MEYYSEVEYNLASKGVRFINYIIDLIIYYVFIVTFFSFIWILGIAENFFSYMEENSLLDRLITMFFYILFMVAQEVIFKGQSIGKFLTKTKVVYENGQTPTSKVLALRNILRIIPFDQLSFLGYLGWHDKWSSTRVVNIKGFEKDIQEKKEKDAIEQIGNRELI